MCVREIIIERLEILSPNYDTTRKEGSIKSHTKESGSFKSTYWYHNNSVSLFHNRLYDNRLYVGYKLKNIN